MEVATGRIWLLAIAFLGFVTAAVAGEEQGAKKASAPAVPSASGSSSSDLSRSGGVITPPIGSIRKSNRRPLPVTVCRWSRPLARRAATRRSNRNEAYHHLLDGDDLPLLPAVDEPGKLPKLVLRLGGDSIGASAVYPERRCVSDVVGDNACEQLDLAALNHATGQHLIAITHVPTEAVSGPQVFRV